MALLIEFVKGDRSRYRSLLYREDGVVVEFDGGSYNKVGGRPEAVPHDLAHLLVEDELALTAGVWGVLAAGGLFGHAKVTEGRQAPHAARRGREIVHAARERVMQAEVLTRVVCDVARGDLPADAAALKRAIGDRWWTDSLTAGVLGRCEKRLRAAAAEWARLSPEGILTASWPHPVDPAMRAGRRRRR